MQNSQKYGSISLASSLSVLFSGEILLTFHLWIKIDLLLSWMNKSSQAEHHKSTKNTNLYAFCNFITGLFG